MTETLVQKDRRTATGHPFRRLAVGAVLGPLQFTVAWLVLGAVSTGYTLWDTRIEAYSPISQPISGLGMGTTGPIMNASFVVLGVLLLGGVVGILGCIPDLTRRQRWGLTTALGLPAVGSVLCGIFDLESFFLHFLGFALVLTPIVGFPAAGLVFRRLPNWHHLGASLLIAGPVTLLLAAAYFATFDPIAAGEGVGIGGLAQRVLVVEILTWYVILGWRVARDLPRRAAQRSSAEYSAT